METLQTFEQSQAPGGAHALLAQLVGEWEGVTRTWFEPDKLADESMWRASIQPLLDGRFVLYEYTGMLVGEALHGYCIIGYNLVREQFEAAWIDQVHMGTGMMFSVGQKTEKGFSVLGSYAVGQGNPDWGWRTEVLLDGENLLVTAYNISPEGQEARGVETRYQRISG